MSSTPRRTTAPARLVLQAWLGSRGLLLVMALAVAVIFHRSLADIVANWDVQHFLEIARRGYTVSTDAAFFPGWPLVLHLLGLVGVPLEISGTIIALACSVAAAGALHQLAGAKAGPWAAAAWLIAPTAVFTAVPYTESLFCALAFWAWERARAAKWAQMAVLAALACTVRVSGLFLVGALAILIVAGDGRPPLGERRVPAGERSRAARRRPLAPLAWLLLPVAALAAYAAYQHARTGDWLAWYHAQTTGWARQLTMPWQSFLNTLPVIMPGAYADHPGWAWVFRGEVASMAVGLVTTVVCLVKRRVAQAAWVFVQCLAFSLSYWWMSVNRAVLLWFPLWILLGELVAWRPRGRSATVKRVVVVVGAVASLALLCAWGVLFFTGMWAS